jgi:Cu-Zn family superoxide dismutase
MMRKQFVIWLAAIGMAASLLSYATAQHHSNAVTVELKDGTGASVGTVTITPVSKDKGVRVKLDLKNLPPGQHGIHFHEMAKCEGPNFESSGAHFNPDSKMHGLKNPKGPHAGDLLNFTVSANGTAKSTLSDVRVNLGADNHSLYTNGGTSIIIHAGKDDLKTDPSGNSGGRIACGVISK